MALTVVTVEDVIERGDDVRCWQIVLKKSPFSDD